MSESNVKNAIRETLLSGNPEGAMMMFQELVRHAIGASHEIYVARSEPKTDEEHSAFLASMTTASRAAIEAFDGPQPEKQRLYTIQSSAGGQDGVLVVVGIGEQAEQRAELLVSMLRASVDQILNPEGEVGSIN